MEGEEIEKLIGMLVNVDLKVHTKRKDEEEEALHNVNILINRLIARAKNGEAEMSEVCYKFIQSCCRIEEMAIEMENEDSDGESGDLRTSFQLVIGQCAVDDRHRIRKRLNGLLKYIQSQMN